MTNSVSPWGYSPVIPLLIPTGGEPLHKHKYTAYTKTHLCRTAVNREFRESQSIKDRHEIRPVSSAWIYKSRDKCVRELHLYIVNSIDSTWKLICQECHLLLHDFNEWLKESFSNSSPGIPPTLHIWYASLIHGCPILLWESKCPAQHTSLEVYSHLEDLDKLV